MSIRDEARAEYVRRSIGPSVGTIGDRLALAWEAGAEWARVHLAAQETYGERAPCGCDLTGPVPPAVHIVDRHEEKQ